MNIQKELDAYFALSSSKDYEPIKERLGSDASKKIAAILDILEIGESSIAHAKLLLHICEDCLEKSSIAFGSKRDV